MKEKYGIILLDGPEVIIHLYQKETEKQMTPIHQQVYDLTSFNPKQKITPTEIIEIIAQTAISKEAINIADWKICARNLPEDTVSQVSYVTNIKAEILTLAREQQLLCNSLAKEF